jgi:hypothetical protein
MGDHAAALVLVVDGEVFRAHDWVIVGEGEGTMAQAPDVRRLLTAGRQLTEAGRSQAFQLRDGLVEQGRETTGQISAVIDKLVNPVGGLRDEGVHEAVRAEVSDQLRTLGSELAMRLAEDQFAADRVAELNRQRRELAGELREVVRDEVQRQLAALDVVTRADLDELVRTFVADLRGMERRLTPAPRSADDDLERGGLAVTPLHQRGLTDPARE